MKHLIMGTAGHVDHGKTSLIKLLTNKDCDTHKEEKRRGITINLGFSYLELKSGESVGIVDVPGHKDFISTMVGGACGIDFVILVIAADSGIMPQTREHVNILNALGINKGIVAITKIDITDDELIEMAKLEISEFLDNTSLKNSPVVGISSVTGKGKEELLDIIEKIIPEIEEKEKGFFFRMYIDRIFSVKGHGNVVTGSVLNGNIQTGDDIFLLPGVNKKYKIRSIERHGKSSEIACAGDRAAINLIGLKKEDVEKGMIISDKLLNETKLIDVNISFFDTQIKLKGRMSVIFHSSTYESSAIVHFISEINSENSNKFIAQIHLSKPAILINKDKFILRNSSGDITLGGGFIIDTSPLHHKRVTPKLNEYLEHLSSEIINQTNIKSIVVNELKKEFRPFLLEEISQKININNEILKTDILNPDTSYLIYKHDDIFLLIYHKFDTNYRNKIISIIKKFHIDNSLSQNGIESNAIFGKTGLQNNRTEKIYLDVLLNELQKSKQIQQINNTWVIHGFKPTIDQTTLKELNWLENEILKYDLQKPAMAEIEENATLLKITKDKIKSYTSILFKEGKIYIYQNEFIHNNVVKKLKYILLNELLKNEDGIGINEFRILTGASKRLCPMLIGIFEAEKIISTTTTGFKIQIKITNKGKETANGSIS